MMVRSGLLTANVAWLGAAPWYVQHDWKGWVAGFGFTMIGSALPDLDHRSSTLGALAGRRTQWVIRKVAGGHRAGTHSLPGVYLVWLLCTFLLDSTQGRTVSDALAIGVLAHMFTDLLTVLGIAWLYPAGYLFIWIGRVIELFGHGRSKGARTCRKIARGCVRFGRLVNAKTRIGWMTTNSIHEKRYCRVVKFVGVALVLAYLFLAAPTVSDWGTQHITTISDEVRS